MTEQPHQRYLGTGGTEELAVLGGLPKIVVAFRLVFFVFATEIAQTQLEVEVQTLGDGCRVAVTDTEVGAPLLC